VSPNESLQRSYIDSEKFELKQTLPIATDMAMNTETTVMVQMTRAAAITMPMMPDGDDTRDGGDGDDCDGGNHGMAMVMVMMMVMKKVMMILEES
jgi:hypothetical protein